MGCLVGAPTARVGSAGAGETRMDEGELLGHCADHENRQAG